DEVHFENAAGSVTFTCSVISAAAIEGTGTVNIDGDSIDSDPLFCAAESCVSAPTIVGEYTLDPLSPAAPDNSPCGLIGALEVGCGVSTVDDLPDPGPGIRSDVATFAAPNPMAAGSDLRLFIPGAIGESYYVELFDVEGRSVGSWTGEIDSEFVTLPGHRLQGGFAPLRPGAYYFRAEAGGRAGTGRVSVVR
ncbi:MAG: hypothetical protein KDA27_26050, partial [Candidatus Eisenbacteria bacterium]|nr:hypothetical protein [Candidatus Eisenbacteria bacterium]